MDLDRAKTEMERVFANDIADGTVDIERHGATVVVNGGNWALTARHDGIVGLDLPMNDPNYYDDDTGTFLENVLNVEVEESLAMLDLSLDGAVSSGLRRSGESWSAVLADRIAAIRA